MVIWKGLIKAISYSWANNEANVVVEYVRPHARIRGSVLSLRIKQRGLGVNEEGFQKHPAKTANSNQQLNN